MEQASRLTERKLDGLTAVLNDWDPIGVYGKPGGPDDDREYDCLRWPLVSRLQRGASRPELAEFLRRELELHFGIGGTVSEDVLDRLIAWWTSITVS